MTTPLSDMRGCKSLHEYASMLERENNLLKSKRAELRECLEDMANAAAENGYQEHANTIHEAIDHLADNGYLDCGDEEIKPMQTVSEAAIAWLFDNHPEIYAGFYERI
ncbi:hypothetical protein GAW91_000174 [Vibrio fluvialis]|nr:hypothetical protein [Vibrio fluvialis]